MIDTELVYDVKGFVRELMAAKRTVIERGTIGLRGDGTWGYIEYGGKQGNYTVVPGMEEHFFGVDGDGIKLRIVTALTIPGCPDGSPPTELVYVVEEALPQVKGLPTETITPHPNHMGVRVATDYTFNKPPEYHVVGLHCKKRGDLVLHDDDEGIKEAVKEVINDVRVIADLPESRWIS